MTVREAVRSSLRLLTPRDRRLLGLAAVIQMATSLLDLAGVALLGMVGLVAVSAVKEQPPPDGALKILSKLGMDPANTALIAVVAGSAAALLIARNVVNPILMARILKFLARREASVSAGLARELLSRPLTFVQQRTSQQTAAALLDGANWATSVVLGQAVVVAAEAALLLLLVIALLVVNPAVAVGVVAYFAAMGVVLNLAMGRRAARLGAERRRTNIASRTALQEALGAYREITVADRRMLYADRIRRSRTQSAETSASLQLVGMLPKYVSEGALVLGSFALATVLFSTQTVAVAAATFAIFLATATRVMPSLLRFQGALLTIRSAGSSALPIYELAAELGDPSRRQAVVDRKISETRVPLDGNPDFVPDIELREVDFTYPGACTPAVAGISLTIPHGTTAALVGRSGAGKSTLADLMLGVLQPDSGSVTLGGVPPADAVRRWPGGVGYVPQDVMLTSDSVRANVALGLPPEAVDDDLVWEALRRAHLEECVRDQTDGLDTPIGERGLRLSGGQRHRLGIARAMFTRPRLLILDEATSALDSETELAITTMLHELGREVTVVVIAHRLSTVRHADLVAYLENGNIVATGTFDELCLRIPALRNQATLMGLRPA